MSFSNELDVALGVAAGVLPSPTRWFNADYVLLRLSGTGVAYRPSAGEYVWRDPDVWLSPMMERRALGLPLVVDHPPEGALTSKYFGDRCVGTVVHAFARNDELWGVGRVIDANACAGIVEGDFDTSPGIIIYPLEEAGAYVDVNGERLLVEGIPTVFDHVALVYTGDGNKGVWTRSDGSNGSGVELSAAAQF